MKRKDFGLAIEALDSVSEIKGVKFAFAVLKNRKQIENQLEEDKPIFEKILTPSDDFKEYETARIELCELSSEKDEEGKPLIEEDKYKILDIEKFNTELTTLTESFKDAVDDRKKQIEEYNSLMEEEIEFVFQKVNFDILPDDLSEQQLLKIEFMLDLD